MTRIAAIVPFVSPLLLGCDPHTEVIDPPSGPGADGSPIAGICAPSDHDDPFADCVEDFSPAEDVSFGHDELPEVVFGPPMPDEAGGGSLDVVSLGCGGGITLFFDPPGIVDGPGADFVVFENPFPFGEETFVEPARVQVSEDGQTWFAFDCALDGTWPPTGCAGIELVHATPGNGLATAPQHSGGDTFDLAEVGLDQASYVRLVDVTDVYYGDTTWCGGGAGGFDLDAVVAVPR